MSGIFAARDGSGRFDLVGLERPEDQAHTLAEGRLGGRRRAIRRRAGVAQQQCYVFAEPGRRSDIVHRQLGGIGHRNADCGHAGIA